MDSRVVAGAVEALQDYGTGAGGSRLVTGTLPIHLDLEQRLAALIGTESALVFSSGYQANLGAVTALSDDDTLLVCDAHIHASLVDAARLSRATRLIVPHNDLTAVRQALAGRTQPKAMVIVESVYSVFGDAAPLADLVELTAAHDATLLVDEAHALGTVGKRGEGVLGSLGSSGQEHVVITTSLSKSLAAQGGAVLGVEPVRNHLVNSARSFIFDTGLAPASAGAALAALRVLRANHRLPRAVRDNAGALAQACGQPPPAAALLSVRMSDTQAAVAAVDICAAHGVRIGCFRPPSTPDGGSHLRIAAHSQHRPDEIAHAVRVLASVLEKR